MSCSLATGEQPVCVGGLIRVSEEGGMPCHGAVADDADSSMANTTAFGILRFRTERGKPANAQSRQGGLGVATRGAFAP